MTPLQDQLDEITSNTRNLVQPERLAISERAVEDLFATGIEDRILPIGAQAPSSRSKTRPASPFAPAISSPSARWSSSSSAAAGALTAPPSWKPGATSMANSAKVVHSWSPSPRKPSARVISWSGSMAFLSRSSLTPAILSLKNSASSTPSPNTTATTTYPSSSTCPSSMAIKAGVFPCPPHTSSRRDGKVLFAEAHADFRVRPEPEEALTACNIPPR